MNIQSLSIVVPNRHCINKCSFCVSRMHCEDIPQLIDCNVPDYALHRRDYLARMAFARDNGCNTVMLTGKSEPQQNRGFLRFFAEMNERLDKPFRWIEIQTTGVLLDDEYLRFLRESVGVSTVSVSVSAFDDGPNRAYTGMPENAAVVLEDLCRRVKEQHFNLRLSVNLTDYFDRYADAPASFFDEAKKRFSPDQLTLRVLYAGEDGSEQSDWVRTHACRKDVTDALSAVVRKEGIPLERLPYGRIKYSLCGMSLVVDDDSMSKTSIDDLKYLILQPNCRLYSRWDDTASLVF